MHRPGRCEVPANRRGWRTHSDMTVPSTIPQPPPVSPPSFPPTPHPPTGPAADPATSLCAAGQRTIDTNVTKRRLGFPSQTDSSSVSTGHAHESERGCPSCLQDKGQASLLQTQPFQGSDTIRIFVPRASPGQPRSPAHLSYRGTQCPSRVLIMAIWTPLSVRVSKSLHTIPGSTEGKLWAARRGSARA